MSKLSSRLTFLLLAFAVGVAAVNAWIYQAEADRNHQTANSNGGITENADSKTSQKTLEMVFVLDTTGSMGGLIDGAKQKIWGIVNEVMQRKDRPKVKVGLVAYRDNGDAYVTQILPLSEDLDKVYSTLMDYRAEGGGDTPENVRRALAEGVEKVGWSKQNANTAQILFLVGDAPPHDDYVQEIDVLTTTAKAVRRNMIVNTIQCGNAADTRQIWQQIAQRGEGKYFAIAQDGGVQAISTPYDSRLAELAGKLGSTYLAYGGGSGEVGIAYREKQMRLQSATESKVSKGAPMAAQADRAMNKAINGAAYTGDLLQSIENETIKLEAVKEEDLPDNLKKLTPAERQKEIAKRLAERKKIRDEILVLSKQRDAFIQEAKKKAGKQDGFDAAVSNALNEQMSRKGIK
jgi:Mg-chelatase subunit ChlD